MTETDVADQACNPPGPIWEENAVPLQKINVGLNPDGSTRYHYYFDEPAEAQTKVVVFAGRGINGTVTLPDGTPVDLTEEYVALDSHEQAGLVSHLVGVKFEEDGHPSHDADQPYYHLCTEACGELERGLDDPKQAAAVERALLQHHGLRHDPAAQEHLEQALGLTQHMHLKEAAVLDKFAEAVAATKQPKQVANDKRTEVSS